MGIYVNPGNILFQKARFSNLYIDKSMLIAKMNALCGTEKGYVCVSRPRRFGKSMAANMLTAYYSRGCDSAELFAGLQIEKEESFQKHLNQHDVIRLNMQRFLKTEDSLDTYVEEIEKSVVSELLIEFPECKRLKSDSSLAAALEQIFLQTGKGFIFILDEWECVFQIAKNRKDAQKRYLDFLRSLFKDAEYTELVYMTGILPIRKYGEHSAINIFDEYSMISPKNLGEYFGFTEEEVHQACGQRGMDYAEVKKWYDGYRVGKFHIYNPKSVADALTWEEIQSYWTGTETYEAYVTNLRSKLIACLPAICEANSECGQFRLEVYIDMNFDELKEAVTMMLGNGRCEIDPSTFQNDMTSFRTRDDVLTLLVHLGYLTYDRETSEVFIPNQEIAQEFLRAVKVGGWDGVVQSLNQSQVLLERTWALDGNAVAEGLSAIHSETSSVLKYHDENSLTCAVLMAYYSAKSYYVNPIMELPSGKGFADVVYLPKRNIDRPALVVELKWDKTADGALRQIKEKKYASWVEGYTGEILLVGINYDKEKKIHECVIEAFTKTE